MYTSLLSKFKTNDLHNYGETLAVLEEKGKPAVESGHIETHSVEGSGGDLSRHKQAWNPEHLSSKRRKYLLKNPIF